MHINIIMSMHTVLASVQRFQATSGAILQDNTIGLSSFATLNVAQKRRMEQVLAVALGRVTSCVKLIVRQGW